LGNLRREALPVGDRPSRIGKAVDDSSDPDVGDVETVLFDQLGIAAIRNSLGASMPARGDRLLGVVANELVGAADLANRTTPVYITQA
jgi:hypothetical protein